ARRAGPGAGAGGQQPELVAGGGEGAGGVDADEAGATGDGDAGHGCTSPLLRVSGAGREYGMGEASPPPSCTFEQMFAMLAAQPLALSLRPRRPRPGPACEWVGVRGDDASAPPDSPRR